jgi:hypothetical protein
VRRIIGAIVVTLAAVALMATSAATANAQSLIEYGLMSGFVASGNDGPEVETLDPAHRLGSHSGLEPARKAGNLRTPPAPLSTARAGTPRSARCPASR